MLCTYPCFPDFVLEIFFHSGFILVENRRFEENRAVLYCTMPRIYKKKNLGSGSYASSTKRWGASRRSAQTVARKLNRVRRDSRYRGTWNPTRRAQAGHLCREARKRAYVRLPKFVLAQTNPFNREVYGVRVPDDNTAPSSSFYSYDDQALLPVTTTGNAIGAYFYPNASYLGVTASTATSSTVGWPATWTGMIANPKATAISNTYELVRPVAHAIKLSCSLAPTSVTGFVHVALFAISTYQASGWNSELPNNVSQMQDLPGYKRFTLAQLTQNPIVVTNRFLDTTAFRYTDPTSGEVASTNPGEFHAPGSWMGILVICEGHGQVITSSPLQVETICHFEGTSKPGGLNSDSPAEPPNRVVMDGAAHTSANMEPSRGDAAEDVRQYEADAAATFAEAAGPGLTYAAQTGVRVAAGYAGRAVGGLAAAAAYGLAGVNDPGRLVAGGANRYVTL